MNDVCARTSKSKLCPKLYVMLFSDLREKLHMLADEPWCGPNAFHVFRDKHWDNHCPYNAQRGPYWVAQSVCLSW